MTDVIKGGTLSYQNGSDYAFTQGDKNTNFIKRPVPCSKAMVY